MSSTTCSASRQPQVHTTPWTTRKQQRDVSQCMQMCKDQVASATEVCNSNTPPLTQLPQQLEGGHENTNTSHTHSKAGTFYECPKGQSTNFIWRDASCSKLSSREAHDWWLLFNSHHTPSTSKVLFHLMEDSFEYLNPTAQQPCLLELPPLIHLDPVSCSGAHGISKFHGFS